MNPDAPNDLNAIRELLNYYAISDATEAAAKWGITGYRYNSGGSIIGVLGSGDMLPLERDTTLEFAKDLLNAPIIRVIPEDEETPPEPPPLPPVPGPYRRLFATDAEV